MRRLISRWYHGFVAMFKSLCNEGDLEINNHEFSSTIHFERRAYCYLFRRTHDVIKLKVLRWDGSGWDGVNCDEWDGWSNVGLHEVLWAKASGVCRGAVGGVGWGEIKHVNWRGRIGAMGGEAWESSGNTREVWGEECSGWKICKVKTYENVP